MSLGLLAHAPTADADDGAVGGDDEVVLAQSSTVRVVADGSWVRYEFARALPHSTVESVTGERVDRDGQPSCVYSGTEDEPVDGLADGEVSVAREVAQNIETCTMTLESAVVREDEARAAGFHLENSDGVESHEETIDDDGASVQQLTRGRYQRLYFEDPPGIDVTSVTARVRWTYTGTCTTSSRHSWGWGWFSASGWRLQSRTQNSARSCSFGARTWNTAEYVNRIFCALIPANTHFDRNYIRGRSDGSVYYEWRWEKFGGCVGLLSFHRATGNWSG